MTSKCHKRVFEVKNGILTIDLKTFLDMIEDIIDRAKKGEDKYDILADLTVLLDEELHREMEKAKDVLEKLRRGEIKPIVVS